MSQTPVIVLGGGMTPIGVLRALHRAGIPAFSYHPEPDIERHSRWYRPLPLRRAVSGADIDDLLESTTVERAVLLPCSDTWAARAASRDTRFHNRFPASLPAPDVLGKLVDKAAFAALLSEVDVPHPVTRTLGSVDELTALPDEVLAGAFLKPTESQAFFARFGVKAFRIASRDEAVARLREVEAAGQRVVLQQYIPGPGSEHYYVEGFVDAGGTLRAVFARQRVRMYPRDFGNSTYMVSVSPHEVAPAIDAMRRLLGHLSFRGIFSAEFKRDARDGDFKLVEVNARAWWYVEFAARCGVDVCSLAYRDALGLSVPTVAAYRVGVRMVYPYYDLSAAREAHALGELSLGDWARSWIGAQQPLFNWTDPVPALNEVWYTLGQKTLRKLGVRRS